MNMDNTQHCCQYGVWPNCCNNCDFCLREEREFLTKPLQLRNLDMIKKNIDVLDWKNKFSYGISLLGGELYYIKDKDIQESFLELVDIIIENADAVNKSYPSFFIELKKLGGVVDVL